MNRRTLAGIAAIAVLAGAGFGAWYAFIRDDAPAPVNLADALAAASTAAAGSSAATPANGGVGTTAAPPNTSTAGDIAAPGTWTLVSDGVSFVGYRVHEELAGIGATTAVGRTEAIAGSLQFDGSTITSVEVAADLTQLRSDESRRDRALRTQAIETNDFPTATFILTSPIAIDGPPAEGSTLSAPVEGDLTIHGVTRPVSMQLEGQIADGRLVVVGSTTVLFADFDIDPPEALSVLSVDDRAVIEMQLVFERTG